MSILSELIKADEELNQKKELELKNIILKTMADYPPKEVIIPDNKWQNKESPGEILSQILNRVGKAEQDIERDKEQIKSIEQSLSDKLKMNFNIIVGILVAVVLAVMWLIWQSFWMYPDINKDYVTATEQQNNKIADFQKEIDILNNELLEAKNRIEQETNRRIQLEQSLINR